ncbi:MAG: NADH-quinone oxidoreductase subunit NuoG [Actinobacteria bacterium]|nr:NADH-quinone oxidoreductase subunit NuoG [Actinomycetota bacterium]
MSDVAVTINGQEIVANKGELVIDAAERHGVYIPRFCYHPRMKPVGMCRMCLVEIDTGRGPALQPSCMIECTPEMKVDTQSPVTKKAQDGVLEFLLINHPLDCPVCDKGGECPLQDQTLTYGPGESRFVEEKRHHEKPIPISDLVLLDRERCILCDRCTRFASEVAGDPLISFLHRGNETEVNTFPDDPFASYFSGNTVQICPVGALTALPYRFKARPWDLEATESTCQGCSVGCRIAIQESRNEVLRYLGVDADPVNWGWLCDKGRFGFEAVGAGNRLRDPLVRRGDQFSVVRWSDALHATATAITAALGSTGPSGIAVIGGARLTNEDAYAWSKLAKGLIGTDNVDCQLGDGLPASAVLGLPKATIDELCAPGATVILLGPDIKEELPVLFLRLKHAVQNDGVKVIEVSSMPTGFTKYASVSIRHRAAEANEAVRALLDGIPAGKDGGGADARVLDAARALVTSGAPLTVLLGRTSLSEQPDAVVDAAAALVDRVPGVKFLSGLRRANVHGALDMGLAPGLLPGRTTLAAAGGWFGRVWPQVPTQTGLDTTGILQAAAAGHVDVLILLGADPLADFPDRTLAEQGLAGARTVIALDTFLNESAQQADVVLAAAGFGECEGTTTNIEGRVSVLNQKVTPPGSARTDWIIAAELARILGSDLQLESVDDIRDEIEELSAAHRGLTVDVLAKMAYGDGVVVPLPSEPAPGADGDGDADGVGSEASDEAGDEASDEAGEPETVGADLERPGPAPIELERTDALEAPPIDAYSYRLVTGRRLYDQGTLVSQAGHLAGLAPGTVLRINPYDFDRLGVAEGTTLPLRSPRGLVEIEVHTDREVPRGTAVMFFNQPGADAARLIDATARVTEVRLETGGPS